MKYLLHIDTSADAGLVMLSQEGSVVNSIENDEPRNQAQNLNLFIDKVLENSGVTFSDLSGIMVCAGPGSYTGLRIGIATAKGICYANDLPLILHNRLVLLAWQAFCLRPANTEKIFVILNARVGEYFIAGYNIDFQLIISPTHVLESGIPEAMSNFENATIITDLPADSGLFAGLKTNHLISDTKLTAKEWALFAKRSSNDNIPADLFSAQPFYLKDVYTHK